MGEIRGIWCRQRNRLPCRWGRPASPLVVALQNVASMPQFRPETAPQVAVGVKAVGRKQNRPPRQRGGRRSGVMATVMALGYGLATAPTDALRARLRVARLKFRLKLCACLLLALSKRLARPAMRFNSCGLLPARRSEFDLLACRMARFDARCPSGRLTGLSCCST